MFEDSGQWAQAMFGGCELGDARRTKRLVDVAGRLGRQTGASLAKCCTGDTAAIQGSYRLIGNDRVQAEAIGQGGFERVAEQAQEVGLLLAVEDTSSLSYGHEVAEDLGSVGTKVDARHRGYLVHSVLLLDADSERTVGLIEQRHWRREDANYGQKHARRQRAYEDKESYKWQQASERMQQRLGATMARTISVCDRESDVYEYLRHKCEQGQRFVIRAQADRALLEGDSTLFAQLQADETALYETTVNVAQRGGRKARQAKVGVGARSVSIKAPVRPGPQRPALTVNVVRVWELQPPAGQQALNWILLSSEPVDAIEAVRRIVRYYELRWRIEEFHKAWKSGVGIERVRLQSGPGIERMLVITAFVAIRLLQLREQMGVRVSEPDAPCETPCDVALSTEQWKVLWQVNQGTPPPAATPTARWACLAIARLGGFADTKRTGRPGWQALWDGWLKLEAYVEGFRIAQRMAKM